jgi:apolipoprotein N-acyltransferase
VSYAAGAASRWTALGARRRQGFGAAAGAVAALGLAPFDLWFLGWIGFAALIALAMSAPTPRLAAWVAWLGATTYFAVALHWIVEPFLVDAARHGWMAPFALAMMSGGLALFWAVPGWLAARVVPVGRIGARVAVLAGLLVLSEAARGVVLTGFPWAQPGHGVIASPVLAVAAWGGAHGLTGVVLGYAGVVAWLVLGGRAKIGGALVAAPLALLLIPVAPSGPSGPGGPVVRLIQPNAPQHLKWREDMIPVFFQRALDLTASAPRGDAPALVIWPETSLPVLLGRSDEARARISGAAGGAEVILGGQRFVGVRARNSAALLDADGTVRQVYDKHHLVPFGEYMPGGAAAEALGLRGMAEVLAAGYAPGPGPALFEIGGALGRAFPMICYEAIFPGYVREVARPDWMLHLTNDAWFGQFSGPYQHLALARLRAVEQGLPVLRAANTGVSAVIDGRGRILASLELNTAGRLDAALPPALPPTPYARAGDLPVLLLVLLATAAGFAAGRAGGPLHPQA